MLMKIGIAVAAALLGVFASAALAVFAWGLAVVEVHDAETNLLLPVPLILADLALAVCPQEPRAQLRETLAGDKQTLTHVLEQLTLLPDVVLVEVDEPDRGDIVRVSTRSSKLVVEVRSRQEMVQVSVPLNALQRLARKLVQ